MIHELLTEGRRSKTNKAKTLATWATKELRKLKNQAWSGTIGMMTWDPPLEISNLLKKPGSEECARMLNVWEWEDEWVRLENTTLKILPQPTAAALLVS